MADNTDKTAALPTLGLIDQVGDPNLVDREAAGRLDQAVKVAGGQTKVARRAGIPLSTLKGYLNGREARRSALMALADACNVSVDWLVTGRGQMALQEAVALHSYGHVDQLAPPPGYVRIPRFAVAASAGAGALTTNEHPQVVEYVAYAEDFLRAHLRRRPEDLGLIEARGDSMEPTIPDGSILTLDVSENQTLENGRLYVVAVGDALVVKRVELRMSAVVLHSDNPRYPPEIIDRTALEQLHVIGRVLLVSAPPR